MTNNDMAPTILNQHSTSSPLVTDIPFALTGWEWTMLNWYRNKNDIYQSSDSHESWWHDIYRSSLTSTQQWLELKSALLADGHCAAISQILVAIILNHIRIIFCPWLGSYVRYESPLEDLRLALLNPEVFLDQALSSSYGLDWLVFGHTFKHIVDIVGGQAMEKMLALVAERRKPGGTFVSNGKREAMIMGALRVIYLVWVLANVEYVFTRSINTYSFLVAYYKLLMPARYNFGRVKGSLEVRHFILSMVLEKHLIQLPIHFWQLIWYIWYGLLPLLRKSVVRLLAGHPGLMLGIASVVGGVTAVIQYRSVFFISLQFSGMFVALGFAVMAVVWLAVEFVSDPVGLKLSTALAMKQGEDIKSKLPSEANERMEAVFGGFKKGARRVVTYTLAVGLNTRAQW